MSARTDKYYMAVYPAVWNSDDFSWFYIRGPFLAGEPRGDPQYTYTLYDYGGEFKKLFIFKMLKRRRVSTEFECIQYCTAITL